MHTRHPYGIRERCIDLGEPLPLGCHQGGQRSPIGVTEVKVLRSIRKVFHVDSAPEPAHTVLRHLQGGRNILSIPILFNARKRTTIHGKGCLSEPILGSDGPTADLQLISDSDLIDVPESWLNH